MSTPVNPQEAVAAMQTQALDAIRTGQAATLEAIRAWNEQAAQFSVGAPAIPELPEEFTKALGQPEEIVDSVYDFAGKLLELNKQFVHQLLEASTPKK